MNNIKKLFLLKGSFPDKILICSEKLNIDKCYDVEDSHQFLSEYKHLLAIAKSPEYEKVDMFINPEKCRMIWFEGNTKTGTCGWISLKNCKDIVFYEYDEKTHEEIFEDLFLKYLQSDNKYIKRALTDGSYACLKNCLSEYEYNFDMITAGQKLIDLLKANYLFDFYNSSIVNLSYFLPEFLTDKQLTEVVAKKYNLINFILCNDKVKPKNYEFTNNTMLADIVKAVMYAIYLINGNCDDLEDIVRDFILLTDTSYQNIPLIHEKYKKFADYLRNKDKYDVDETISFKEVENILGEKLDYQMFYYANFFRDYGYLIKRVDFENEIIYLDISYL